MGKAYTRFQTKTVQKPRAAHTYMAYIREYKSPPPTPPPGHCCGNVLLQEQNFTMWQYLMRWHIYKQRQIGHY